MYSIVIKAQLNIDWISYLSLYVIGAKIQRSHLFLSKRKYA